MTIRLSNTYNTSYNIIQKIPTPLPNNNSNKLHVFGLQIIANPIVLSSPAGLNS